MAHDVHIGYCVWVCTGRFRVGLNFGKGRRGSPSTDQDQTGKGTNNSSPSKSNIRVLEIMASGSKEQPASAAPPTLSHAPPPGQSIKPSSPPVTSVSTVVPEGALPLVDVHVSSAAPLTASTVPAFSSQYMVAVAIDFGSNAALYLLLPVARGARPIAL